jgi:hypothetical protein
MQIVDSLPNSAPWFVKEHIIAQCLKRETLFSDYELPMDSLLKASSVLSCLVTLIKTNTVDPKRLHPFLAAFGRILHHSYPAPIYSVFKLTTALINLKLMPATVFADILEHILSFPKFLD